MIVAQITDLHIKLPGRLAYRKVDTALHALAGDSTTRTLGI